MKCTICKRGATRPGETDVALQRDGATVIVRHVPAEVCQNCGEAYVSQEVSRTLLGQAEQALAAGVVVSIREYRPAVA